MKFNLNNIPDGVKTQVKVGNIYSARGGSRKTSPRMWVLVSIDDAGDGVVLLGLDASGVIVSGVKYYRYTVEKWPVIGECTEVSDMEFTVRMF